MNGKRTEQVMTINGGGIANSERRREEQEMAMNEGA
jgi:hypothetical protein